MKFRQPAWLAGWLAALTQLQQLYLQIGMMPAGLTDSLLSLRQLTSLQLAAASLPPLVALSRLQQLCSWEVILDSSAGQVPSQPLILPPPSAFPCLKEYNLQAPDAAHVQIDGHTFDAALAALLQHTPRLQSRSVVDCLEEEEPFPDSLRTLAGPTFLSLSDNHLEDLPEGPCWAGLRQLDLSHNSFRELPWALSTATQLTSLSVRGDNCFDYACAWGDEDDLLSAHLPALDEFDTSYTKGWVSALMQLARRRPLLSIDTSYIRAEA
ncbi:leucine-rich repeat-containing [Chlorella sorokiniana]|uniref:Leucine-rich repeat-containing n=1 Tax=Chlorella sorokiniana TaxID=3076 RepID=A0A2P6TVF8_CHLSO|nr:leucine-rich repeat-containing [Chlorella sorokiniana]|eukprot:PRW58052.1 leucine-rich repeat-containing [Chlorella sorokiniana]